MNKIIFTTITLFSLTTPSFISFADDAASSDATQEFAGINFGVGISLTSDLGENDRISSAILDENDIIRVETEQNAVARIMLESHYFFKPKTDDFSFFGIVDGIDWGHGPFVALQPGTDEIIEAIGIGWMIGFRRDKDSSSSWNIGIGYVVDPSVNTLGDGMIENQPIPEGESQIRYKERSQDGIFLIASFNF